MSVPSDTPAPNTKSVVAGAGTGTGLVGLADLLPDTWEPFKTILTYSSPALSVGVSVVWLIVSGLLLRWYSAKQVDKAIAEARVHRDEICGSPTVDQEHAENARAMVKKLEVLKFAIIERRVSALEVKMTGS